MGVFQDAIKGGLRSINTAAGVDITYIRGESSISIKAVVGRSPQTTSEEGALVIDIDSRPYMVMVEDLVIDDAETVPMRGDQIQETIDGEDLLFEVLPMPGKQESQYSDAGRTQFRINTKRIE